MKKKFFIICFLINLFTNPNLIAEELAVQEELLNQNSLKKKVLKRKKLVTYSLGSYATGVWDMRPLIKGEDFCSIWTFCTGFEGINFSFTHTDVLKEKGKFSLDFDKQLTLSWQGTDKNMKRKSIEYGESFFASAALLSSLRITELGQKFPFGIGIGIGPVLSIGEITVQEPYEYGPIMSRVNFEIIYPLNKKANSSLVFGINHDCSFFGLLAPDGQPQFSHSWYSLGFRKQI